MTHDLSFWSLMTNASLIVREDYSFDDGLFSGYNAEKRQYDKTSWNYELDENGFAKRDTTLQHPRCVWNLLKQHVSRYTPDVVENICGTPKADFLKVCEYIAETSAPDKTASFLYALGWTQHSIGAQNIRTMAMIQLLLTAPVAEESEYMPPEEEVQAEVASTSAPRPSKAASGSGKAARMDMSEFEGKGGGKSAGHAVGSGKAVPATGTRNVR